MDEKLEIGYLTVERESIHERDYMCFEIGNDLENTFTYLSRDEIEQLVAYLREYLAVTE